MFALFAGCPYGAVLLDEHGRIADVNPAAERLLGAPREQLLGRVPPSPVDGALETTVAALDDGTAMLYLRDDTRERELAADLARREVVAAAVRDAVIETDEDFRIVRWNRGAERIYGWSAADVMGRPASEVLVSEIADEELSRMIGDLDERGHVLMLATQQTASGKTIEVEASVIRLGDDAGQVTGYVSINRDVSLRRRLEERLQETRHLEMVARLAGGVAHDLNTLLTTIMGYTELTLSDGSVPAHVRPDLNQIVGAVDRASTLTTQLLSFSRSQVLEPRRVDLNEIIRGTVAARRRIAGRGIEFVERPAESLAAVHVDQNQFERALLDIVANAAEAMAGAGRVTVQTENVTIATPDARVPRGRYARLAVTDMGIGMDDVIRARAFEPFFTTKRGHTGLGLASVHGFVNQSGGHVVLESAPGQGTVVELFLPAIEGRPPDGSIGRPPVSAI